jgi:hypothetical protein
MKMSLEVVLVKKHRDKRIEASRALREEVQGRESPALPGIVTR